jgi:tRNA pseudouridine(38-40) synthase
VFFALEFSFVRSRHPIRIGALVRISSLWRVVTALIMLLASRFISNNVVRVAAFTWTGRSIGTVMRPNYRRLSTCLAVPTASTDSAAVGNTPSRQRYLSTERYSRNDNQDRERRPTGHTDGPRKGSTKRSGDRPDTRNQISHKPSSLEPKDRIKRKVALAVGYVGTNYSGLQYGVHDPLKTIEGVVEDCLGKLGYISEDNRNDPTKISWSRSSRTDKGVHAARILLSAKLAIQTAIEPEEEFENEDQRRRALVERKRLREVGHIIGTLRYPHVVDELNKVLPADIRALSCIKVARTFNARSACTWREYEYLFPAEMLLPKTVLDKYTVKNDDESTSVDPAVFGTDDFKAAFGRCHTALSKMEGSNSFHNFHRLKPMAVLDPKRRLKRRFDNSAVPVLTGHASTESVSGVLLDDNEEDLQRSMTAVLAEKEGTNSEMDNEDDIEEDFDGERDSELVTAALTEEGPTPAEQRVTRMGDHVISRVFEDWQRSPRIICPKTKGSVYICEADLLQSIKTKEAEEIKLASPMVRVLVRGQSFLLQ